MKRLPKTDIEYLTHTWSPITGCLNSKEVCHAHDQCWARSYSRRFWKRCGEDKDFKPMFHPERLEEPLHTKKPARIGVCFRGDIFSDSIQLDDIVTIASSMKEIYWHKFFVLSKNYESAKWFHHELAAKNVYVGVSITDQESALRAKEYEPFDFVSLEPLLEDVPVGAIPKCRWLVIGCQTGPGAKKPEKDWIKTHLAMQKFYKGRKLFLKNNLLKLYPDLPRIQELL